MRNDSIRSRQVSCSVKESFGTTAEGVPVDVYTLTNAGGMEVRAITYGGRSATILTLETSRA